MSDPVIKIKRSAVAGKIPTPDQLPLGEVALNTYDGYLYASKNVGIGTTVVVINPFRVGAGTDNYNAYFTAGNVGIGSTLPSSKLSVIGDISASGIVTASGGFNLGISSAGTSITSGPITTLNFVGAGNTFAIDGTTVDISISGGGGSSVSIGTEAPANPSSGDLWYSPDYGRIFIYYDENIIGIGTDQYWVDAAPLNGGNITSLNGPLTIYGNLKVVGSVTAQDFDSTPLNAEPFTPSESGSSGVSQSLAIAYAVAL